MAIIVEGLRKYVVEYIQNIDKILADLKRAGCTILAEKLEFCVSLAYMVGFICTPEGRLPGKEKVEKILTQRVDINITSVRGFLGICVYFRIWIECFAIIVEPLFRLLREDVAWEYGEEQKEAELALKTALITLLLLITIVYGKEAGVIIIQVDALNKGWGAVMMQICVDGQARPARYESGMWSKLERRYDSGKQECRALLHALKRFWWWVYRVCFQVCTDYGVVVKQLHKGSIDMVGALLARWIGYLRLQDFEIEHVPGKKNGVADALLRMPSDELIEVWENAYDELDEHIDRSFNSISNGLSADLMNLNIEDEDELMTDNEERERQVVEKEMECSLVPEDYTEESQAIARYVAFMKILAGLKVSKLRKFIKRVKKFVVRENYLFVRASKNVPLRRVVDKDEHKRVILKALYDESEYKGREGTYRRVADCYYWNNLWQEV